MIYSERKIKFGNYSILVEHKQNHDWYDWCVFVDEGETVLRDIQKVEYLLHPSFHNPRRIADNRENRFAVFSNGWGEFDIEIIIWFTDGSAAKATHSLRLLENNWPVVKPDTSKLPSDIKQVYTTILNSDFKWRKLSSIQRLSGMDQVTVDKSIKKMQEMNLVRIAPYNALDGSKLIGATASVGIEPKIRF